MTPAHKYRRVLLSSVLLLSFLSWAHVRSFGAESLDETFSRARSELQATLAGPNERKVEALRRCIEQFEQIIRQDSARKYSDRCTYLIAQSHHRIHDITHGRDDLKAAKEGYKAVVQKFPTSPLADDAQYLTGILSMSDDPAQAYIEFCKVGIYFPKGDMRSKALKMTAHLGEKLGYAEWKKKDRAAGSRNVTAGSPPSGLQCAIATRPASGAQTGSGGNPGAGSFLSESQPASLSVSSGASSASASGGKRKSSGSTSRTCADPSSGRPGSTLNQLKRVQHWSGPDFTRVVLYMSDPVTFKEQTTQADPRTQQPGRISLDLKNCVLTSKVNRRIRVMDTFLREVHSTQVNESQAKVVLDTEPIHSYRIFSMADPVRLVIDVRGRKQKTESQTASPCPAPAASGRTGAVPKATGGKTPVSTPDLARQLCLGVKRIVLDPGHGGKDKGAISPNKCYEKDITLAIAKELKEVLEAETGCEVILTRARDRFLSLEERTAIANTQKADLFISIHTNAHENRSLHGVETYFLNLSKDKESARVAALENATSTKKISDLEAILQDLMLHTKINESSQLASEVQRQIIGKLRSRYDGIRDLGIKQAPFYVLLGAEMPSILIETAFLTNEREELRLKDRNFQQNLARAISAGIGSYIRQMKSFAKAGDQS
jgi:N-acetylmuramoyl-L-alanine amidase